MYLENGHNFKHDDFVSNAEGLFEVGTFGDLAVLTSSNLDKLAIHNSNICMYQCYLVCIQLMYHYIIETGNKKTVKALDEQRADVLVYFLPKVIVAKYSMLMLELERFKSNFVVNTLGSSYLDEPDIEEVVDKVFDFFRDICIALGKDVVTDENCKTNYFSE